MTVCDPVLTLIEQKAWASLVLQPASTSLKRVGLDNMLTDQFVQFQAENEIHEDADANVENIMTSEFLSQVSKNLRIWSAAILDNHAPHHRGKTEAEVAATDKFLRLTVSRLDRQRLIAS